MSWLLAVMILRSGWIKGWKGVLDPWDRSNFNYILQWMPRSDDDFLSIRKLRESFRVDLSVSLSQVAY
jgi:hypothetical protein